MRISVFPCLIGLTLLVGALFAIWPQIDLAAAAAIYGPHGFEAAHERVWEIVRQIGYRIPTLLMGLFALLFVLRRLALVAVGPSGRSVLFLALTLALGPGLLVNGALKNLSHRPRPVQVSQFGGPDVFRPWYRFDGACARNCSFVSGEVAAAFWTVAPALLAPPTIRVAAVAAALTFGVGTAALRLAFGGHFLSDTALAALFTLLIIIGAARWFGVGAPTRRTGKQAPDVKPRRLRERQPSL